MPTDTETLEIVIELIDRVEDDLADLITQLEGLDVQAERVDDILINLDVMGEADLEQLRAEMESMDEFEEVVLRATVRGEQDINQLLAQLGLVELAEETASPVVVRAEARGEAELARLQTQLAALRGQRLASVIGGGGGIDDLLDAIGEGAESVAEGADAAGDAMRKTGDAAEDAEDGFRFTNLRMSDLHNALANVVPLLVVYIGTLPALIAAIGALAAAAISAAAALGAIAGFGFLGAAMARGDGDFMEGASDILDQVLEDFLDAFTPLSRSFRPLFDDMLDGLDRLFQRIADLAPILRSLADDARAFGRFMSDWIVGLIRDMGRMADAFAPIFAMVGGFIEDMDLLRNLTDFLADILPAVVLFTRYVVGLIQRLAEMSQGFLQVANVLNLAFSMLMNFVNVLGISDRALGALIAVFLIAASAAAIFGSALIQQAIPGLIRSAQAAYGAAVSYYELAAAEGIATISTVTLQKALMGLLVTLSAIGGIIVLANIVAGLAAGFGSLSTNISDATKSLRNFDSVASRMSGNNPYRSPDLNRGEISGSSRTQNVINMNIENGDPDTLREQGNNLSWRLDR